MCNGFITISGTYKLREDLKLENVDVGKNYIFWSPTKTTSDLFLIFIYQKFSSWDNLLVPYDIHFLEIFVTEWLINYLRHVSFFGGIKIQMGIFLTTIMFVHEGVLFQDLKRDLILVCQNSTLPGEFNIILLHILVRYTKFLTQNI